MDPSVTLARFFPAAIRSDEDRIFLEVMLPAAKDGATPGMLYEALCNYRHRVARPVYRYEVMDATRRRAQWLIEQLRTHDGLTTSPEVQACVQVLNFIELVQAWQRDKGQSWNWDLVFDDEDRWQDSIERLRT